MRFVIQVCLTAAVFMPRMGVSILHTKQLKLQLARGVCMVIASVSFVVGLLYVPIGEATAVVFLSPLLLTWFAGKILKEKIKLGQWIAVGSGLVGVMVIVRPGSDLFTPAILLPLTGAFSMAIFQLLTRRLLTTDHIVSTNFITGVFCTIIMSSLVWYFWETPTLPHFLLMLVGGSFATIGHLLLTYSYRHGSVVMLAPFSYAQIVFSSIVAFLYFGHIPDQLTINGAWPRYASRAPPAVLRVCSAFRRKRVCRPGVVCVRRGGAHGAEHREPAVTRRGGAEVGYFAPAD